MEMQALLEEIGALVEKIKNGSASLGELEAFAAATQQLNERAIILKYKAIEAKVYATSVSAQPEIKDEPIHEPEKLVEEPEVELPVQEVVQPEEPVEDIAFDLFSIDEEEEIQDEAEVILDVEPEVQNDPMMFEEEVNSNPEPEIELPTEVSSPILNEVPVTPIVEEPKIESAPISHATANEHPLLSRARANDGSLQSRLLSVRLETLKNAFGLNERMQIVRELFGGDNDLYNEIIDELDNLNEVGSARKRINHFAHHYGWREDSELAIEFVQKVERRYA